MALVTGRVRGPCPDRWALGRKDKHKIQKKSKERLFFISPVIDFVFADFIFSLQRLLPDRWPADL